MYQEITIQRLSAGSIFKLVAIGSMVSLVPFFVLMGILAFFGANTVTWNHDHLYGIQALLTTPFIGVMISLMVTLFLGAFLALGLWVYSKFKPLTLLVKQGGVSTNG